jgi:coiled-coil domain-containing protein 130
MHDVLIILSSEKDKLADPMYKLEHQGEDIRKKKEEEPVLIRLQRLSDSRHSDDYSLNRALRDRLRVIQ